MDRVIRVRVLDRNERSIPDASVHVFADGNFLAKATAGTDQNGTVYTIQIKNRTVEISLEAEYQDGNTLKKLPRHTLPPDKDDALFRFQDVEVPPVTPPNDGSNARLWAGFICLVVALLFFIVLTLLPSFGRPLQCSQHFPAIIVLALAAALGTGFLGGEAKARGQIPLPFNLSPLQIAAAGGVATLIIILSLGWWLYVKDCTDSPVPSQTPAGSSQTPAGSSQTPGEPSQTPAGSPTSGSGTTKERVEVSEALIARATDRLEKIADYVSTLEQMNVAPEEVIARRVPFFGPIDRTRVGNELRQWRPEKERLRTAIAVCRRGEAACAPTVLEKTSTPDPAPPEGKIFSVYTPRDDRTIDLKSATENVLLHAGEYRANVTIAVRGEWVGRWFSGDEMSRCIDTIAQYLRFQSGTTTFTLPADVRAGRRNAIAGRLVQVFSSTRGRYLDDDIFLLSGWPRDRALSVSLRDPNGYTYNQVCPPDLPRVLVWQPDERFEADDVSQIRFYW